jgi:hypothetical protein
MVESFRGNSELAADLIQQALVIANRNEDEWEWGYAMSCAVHAYAALGEFDRATELAAALVPRVRRLGNPTRIADALLADSFAVGPADPRRACLELAEAADLFELVGNLPMGGAIASNGVQLALGAGDVPLAASFLRRRITTVRRATHYVLDPFLPLFALHICAVLRVGGLLAEAAVMLGASDALMVEAHLLYLLPGARVQQEPELRATLLTDEYRDAVARGAALNRDEILDFADASLALLAEDSPLTSE